MYEFEIQQRKNNEIRENWNAMPTSTSGSKYAGNLLLMGVFVETSTQPQRFGPDSRTLYFRTKRPRGGSETTADESGSGLDCSLLCADTLFDNMQFLLARFDSLPAYVADG